MSQALASFALYRVPILRNPAARLLIGAAAGICLLAAATVAAEPFHAGGVGACSVCHVMHNSEDGQPVQQSGLGGYSALLRSGSASDVCLGCHATDNGRVLGGNPLSPPPELGAGNFVFLLEDNLNDGADGLIAPIPGDAAGHNVRTVAYGIDTDRYRSHAPGGSYPSNKMRCTSCHDPHGNGNFRMLRGAGPVPGSPFRFRYPAPVAYGLPLGGAPESDGNHTAYVSGMSAWCANCHGDYLTDDHNQALTGWEHPTEEVLENDVLNQYNIYNGTADPTGGTHAVAYLASVPFEDAGNTVTGTSGPTVSSRLMCLSCHRAHATSAPSALRWDPRVDRLGEDGVVSGSYAIPNPYADPDQEPLCFKCHGTGTGN